MKKLLILLVSLSSFFVADAQRAQRGEQRSKLPVYSRGKEVATKEHVDSLELGGGGATASYLVYTAILTQSGTNAPVATVLENTLGGTITISYNGVGNFTGTATVPLPTLKTVYSISNSNNGLVQIFTNEDNTTFGIKTQSFGEFGPEDANGIIYYNMLEIRVYPEQ